MDLQDVSSPRQEGGWAGWRVQVTTEGRCFWNAASERSMLSDQVRDDQQGLVLCGPPALIYPEDNEKSWEGSDGEVEMWSDLHFKMVF